MLRLKVLCIGLVSVLLVLSSQAFAAPDAMSAVYKVSRNNKSIGYLESRLSYSGDQYVYKKFTKATGLAKILTNARITEESTGKLEGHKVTPLTYSYHEHTRSKKRVEQARFAPNQATGIYKNNAYSVATPGNVVDRASLELVVARDLKRALPNLVYPVMERGAVKTYAFQRLGTERLETPAGVFEVIKLSVKRDGSRRETTYWMAKELGYLPAKMLHREKGDVIMSVVGKYSKGH